MSLREKIIKIKEIKEDSPSNLSNICKIPGEDHFIVAVESGELLIIKYE